VLRNILVAAAMAALAVPAFADTAWTAVPVQPTAQSDLEAGGVLWNCDNSGCRTAADLEGASPMSACWSLVRKLGPLTAFSATAPFNADHLTKCNQVASKTTH
jgi:hypothetical protein